VDLEKASGKLFPLPTQINHLERVCKELDAVPDINVHIKEFFLIVINKGNILPISNT
jgi:hypothetical protein